MNGLASLTVWRDAVRLVNGVYAVCARFPKSELQVLVPQMKRAAISVPSNIAEGQGMLSARECRRFLGHSRGSLLELSTQITIACNLDYIAPTDAAILHNQIDSVGRLLNGLLRSMDRRIRAGKSSRIPKH